MLWFTDLTVADPYYILPVVNTALLITTIEVRGLRTNRRPAPRRPRR